MRLSVPYSDEVHTFWTLMAAPGSGRRPGSVQFPGDQRRWVPVGLVIHVEDGAPFIDVRFVEMRPLERMGPG